MVRRVLLLWMRVEHGVPPCILTLRRRRTERGREMRLLQPRWHTSKKGSNRKKRFCAGSLMRLRSYRGLALRPAFSPLLKLKSGMQNVRRISRQPLCRFSPSCFFHSSHDVGYAHAVMLDELFLFSRLAELVMNAHEFHRCRKLSREKFRDGASQSSRDLMFLDGDNGSRFAGNCEDDFFI